MYFSLSYYEYTVAKEAMEMALTLSGLKIELVGALGKRTRFQLKSLAQLQLKVFARIFFVKIKITRKNCLGRII
jgi:hypothetical protein